MSHSLDGSKAGKEGQIELQSSLICPSTHYRLNSMNLEAQKIQQRGERERERENCSSKVNCYIELESNKQGIRDCSKPGQAGEDRSK